MLAGTLPAATGGEEGKASFSHRDGDGRENPRFTHEIRVPVTIFVSEWHTHQVRSYMDRGGDVKTLASVLVAAALCAACGGSQPGAETETAAADGTAASTAARPAAPAAPRFREVTLPAGTTLRLTLQSAIASDTSQVEDVVRAELSQPVVEDGVTVLPAGTAVAGNVTDAVRSGRVKGRARLAYRFNSLIHDKERYEIATAPLSHEADATKGEDATKIAVGAGAGAAIGALLGGGDGAAKGAAIGGAGGTGAVLATRGEEVRLGSGANVTTRLTAPLTLRIPN
jgi:hypothetical protein